MQSNLFMYLTAMSAVSIHNLVSNFNDVTKSFNSIELKTLDSNWTLDNEYRLHQLFPKCNGSHQSPINIETAKVRENINLRLGLTAYDKPVSGFLMNEFATFRLVPFSFVWPRPNSLVSNSLARSFNPYADSHFTLNYVEFHWSDFWNHHQHQSFLGLQVQPPNGSKNSNNSSSQNVTATETDDHGKRSSVHRIDNQDYPAEIHFVHLNTAYTNIEEALTKPNGLLILAVMVTPSTHESYIFDKLLDGLGNITSPGQQVVIEEDTTWRSLLPTDTSSFYRYHGSMIHPPCHESVQWILFKERLKLGHKQLKRLALHKFIGESLIDGRQINWTSQRRKLQPLNNRTVERSFTLRRAKQGKLDGA